MGHVPNTLGIEILPTRNVAIFGHSALCWSESLSWCVLRRVAGWVAGGCWDDEIDSDEMDHSRKFPAFSISK